MSIFVACGQRAALSYLSELVNIHISWNHGLGFPYYRRRFIRSDPYLGVNQTGFMILSESLWLLSDELPIYLRDHFSIRILWNHGLGFPYYKCRFVCLGPPISVNQTRFLIFINDF